MSSNYNQHHCCQWVVICRTWCSTLSRATLTGITYGLKGFPSKMENTDMSRWGENSEIKYCMNIVHRQKWFTRYSRDQELVRGCGEQVPRPETRCRSRGTKVSHDISALTGVTTYTHREEAHTNRPGFTLRSWEYQSPRGKVHSLFPQKGKKILKLQKSCQMTTPPTESVCMKKEDG